MTSRLFSRLEVASILGVRLDTLYRYARSGTLRALKIGKLWGFTLADIEEFTQGKRYVAPRAPATVALLPEVLREAAWKFNQQGWVVCGAARRSYPEIDFLSDRLSQVLLARGIEPGDRVVLMLGSCVEFVIACFAVWKARGIVVAEDSAIRPNNLEHILSETQPSALIIDRNVATQLEEMLEAHRSVKAILVKDQTFALSDLPNLEMESLQAVLECEAHLTPICVKSAQADDVVSITYTSGSTGTPKGVMHTHESWLAGATFTREYMRLSSSDKILIPLPLHHAYAFRQILAYLCAGGTVVIAADIYHALRLLREQRPTAMLLVPAACNIILDHFPSLLSEADSFLRYIEVGSAPLGAERLRALRELLPTTPVHLPYGLTEARVGFLEAGPDRLFNGIAKVSPGLEVQVVDSEGHPVPSGQTGEIVLRGRGLMKGYWRSPQAERERLNNNWFRTGDMGCVDNLGQVVLLGRIDDVIKLGGRKVNPLEIEVALNKHVAVAESAVTGLPDPRRIFEQELHAFVVMRKGATASEAELLAHCRQYLEPYKIPARIHFRLSLPKSPVGKLQRHLLASEEAGTKSHTMEVGHASSD